MIIVKYQEKSPKAFSLIEMLVVISIIGVLAGLLLPVVNRAKTKAKVATARKEIADLALAINRYKTDYGQYPAPPENLVSAGSGDFTYGTHNLTAPTTVTNGSGYNTNNSALMSMLMAITTNRDNSMTMNFDHSRNPRKIIYSNAKLSDGTAANPLPGVGLDGVYRDPWGNPYIVTIDMSYDEFCLDGMYRRRGVSQVTGTPGSPQGHYGLFNSVTNTGHSDDFALRAPVMVWSFGPDKGGNLGPNLTPPYPDGNANQNPNADNILSWR